MYLYYDKTKTLKEVINDSAIIADSVNANKIYVMYENDQSETPFDTTYIRYLKGDGNPSVYFLQNDMTNPYADTPSDNCYIPYDKNRDLKFFEYGKAYRFRIFNIPSSVLSVGKSASATVWYANDPENNTNVNSSGVLEGGADDTAYAMERFAFAINAANGSVALSENISLEQWNQLLILIGGLDTQTEDITQLKSDVLALQGYFTNGDANNALALNGYAASHYATQSDIETLQSAINAIKQLDIIIPTTIANCPNVATITIGGTTAQGTLAPSESTLYKLYLCNDPDNPVTSDLYTEYLTTKTYNDGLGEYVYKWEKFGTTPSTITTYVSTIGGQSGAITLGSGLSMEGSELQVTFPQDTGVASIGGANGVITLDNELEMVANALGIKGLPVVTIAPVANNTSGVYKIALLNSRPLTRYSGYIYIITEA